MRNIATALFLTSVSSISFAQSFTPNDIQGRWALGNQHLIFSADGSMEFCTNDVPFTLSSNGDQLTINSITTYDRLTGSGTNNIIGNWRDNPNGEEVYYRSDGRYLGLFDGEKVAYLGTYTTDFSASTLTISSCEYRTRYAVSGNALTQWNLDNGIQTSFIDIVPNTSLTIFGGNTPQVWTWDP